MKRDARHTVKVSSYSGYKGNQRPMAFIYEGTTRHVVDIVSQWVEQEPQPGEVSTWYYRVTADDSQYYLLHYDGRSQEWFLEEDIPPSL